MKNAETHPILLEMQRLLSVAPYPFPFETIAAYVGSLEQGKRDRLLAICETVFADADLRKLDGLRVPAAKTMVALVPESATSIKRWISTRSGKYVCEVHFSLFCFLDQLPFLPGGEELAADIPTLVESYLLEVKTDSAGAAFMAGDLLGDHWDVAESLPVLLKVANESRFAAGRYPAIHGLGHAADRLPESNPARKTVISVLRKAARIDRSSGVRASAWNALGSIGKPPRIRR